MRFSGFCLLIRTLLRQAFLAYFRLFSAHFRGVLSAFSALTATFSEKSAPGKKLSHRRKLPYFLHLLYEQFICCFCSAASDLLRYPKHTQIPINYINRRNDRCGEYDRIKCSCSLFHFCFNEQNDT